MQKLSFRLSTDTCRFFGLLLGWFGGFCCLVGYFSVLVLFFGFVGFFIVVGVFLGESVFVFIRKQERVVFKSFLRLGSNHMVCAN